MYVAAFFAEFVIADSLCYFFSHHIFYDLLACMCIFSYNWLRALILVFQVVSAL